VKKANAPCEAEGGDFWFTIDKAAQTITIESPSYPRPVAVVPAQISDTEITFNYVGFWVPREAQELDRVYGRIDRMRGASPAGQHALQLHGRPQARTAEAEILIGRLR
jgi:hypothetical protein